MTSALSQRESLLGQTVRVTAFFPRLVAFVVDTEVGASETSVECCFPPVTRFSAYVMVELVPEWSELSMVFVERASAIKSACYH